MKIAIVCPVAATVPPETYGGIQFIVDQLVRGLAKRGHEVTVFCSGKSTIGGENIWRVETSPYPTIDHSDENRFWEKRQLLSVIERQEEFDVIHLNYEPIVLEFENGEGTVDLLDFFSAPVVVTFHNATNMPKHIEYYENKNLPGLVHAVFISEKQRSHLSFLANTSVIYNGIPVERFPFDNSKEEYLLFLGRITHLKGISEAIEVSQKTRIPLVIAANIDTSDRDFFNEKVAPQIDGKLVRYVGEADFAAKIGYLKKARCLLFPVLWEEPFGLVMIEALACGTPVIAFGNGSVPEIIQKGVNGFIVSDVEEMVQAVGKVKDISPERCRETVKKLFSSEHMVDEYENLFKKI